MRMLFSLAIIALCLLVAILLGRGITGMMVAQSCCFPPDCPRERICAAANPSLERPAQAGSLLAPGLLLLAGMLLALRHHERR